MAKIHQVTVHLPVEYNLFVTATDLSSVTVRQIGGTARTIINPNRSIRIGPFSEPKDFIIYSDYAGFTHSITSEKLAYNHEGTGLFTGGMISINGSDNTKFDITAGTGVIVDNYTNPEEPEVHHVSWPAQIGLSVTYLATNFISFCGIDINGELQQFSAPLTPQQRRDIIFIGGLTHTSNLYLDDTLTAPIPGYDHVHAFIDMADTFGTLTKIGNIYEPNGANLKIDRSAGQSFGIGRNWINSSSSPNVLESPAALQVPMLIGGRDGAGGFQIFGISTDMPVGFYDNNSGTPVAVPASDPWQIFRMYFGPNGQTNILAYGQNLYKTQAEAEAAIFGEVFETSPELSQTVLRAFIIAKRDATDLTDTGKAKFIQADIFGNAPATGITTSTTTLQQAYANSDQPEIVTNTTQQALTLKEGTGTATNRVIEITNNSGVRVFSVDGQGRITGAIAGGATGSRPGSPVTYQMYFDSTLGKPIWYNGTNWVDAIGTIV